MGALPKVIAKRQPTTAAPVCGLIKSKAQQAKSNVLAARKMGGEQDKGGEGRGSGERMGTCPKSRSSVLSFGSKHCNTSAVKDRSQTLRSLQRKCTFILALFLNFLPGFSIYEITAFFNVREVHMPFPVMVNGTSL